MAAPQHPFELYAIDSLFNEEQLAMRDSVRKFVDDRVKPYVGQWFEDGEFPARELAKEIGQMGMFGICLLYTSPSPRDRTRSRMPSSA